MAPGDIGSCRKRPATHRITESAITISNIESMVIARCVNVDDLPHDLRVSRFLGRFALLNDPLIGVADPHHSGVGKLQERR